jgi:transcriptional regulator with XRE-family HTH domain
LNDLSITRTTSNEKKEPISESSNQETSTEMLVGTKIRELRNSQELSLRNLAEISGLNINTLSLIENGKSSPSVSTLQQLSKAMGVPITAFFESERETKKVIFTDHDHRTGVTVSNSYMENLGKDLKDNVVQPFVMTLKQGAGSGDPMIVHTGHEFVYCLSGKILYKVENEDFHLLPGDSLVFEAHLPHHWENVNDGDSQIILVLFPADLREKPGCRHFVVE